MLGGAREPGEEPVTQREQHADPELDAHGGGEAERDAVRCEEQVDRAENGHAKGLPGLLHGDQDATVNAGLVGRHVDEHDPIQAGGYDGLAETEEG
jgi:hypothetical protein